MHVMKSCCLSIAFPSLQTEMSQNLPILPCNHVTFLDFKSAFLVPALRLIRLGFCIR